jgi:hypothetical protein
MENEQTDELIDNDDENAFGPHVKEYSETYKTYFFTTLYKVIPE